MTKGLELLKTQFYRLRNNDTALFCGGATAVCLYYYFVLQPVILDDAFIYFRIVNNLIETGRPVFNIGDFLPLWQRVHCGHYFCCEQNCFSYPFVLSFFFNCEDLVGDLIDACFRLCLFRFFSIDGKGCGFYCLSIFSFSVDKFHDGKWNCIVVFCNVWVDLACTCSKTDRERRLFGMGYLARGEFVLAAVPLLLCFCWTERSAAWSRSKLFSISQKRGGSCCCASRAWILLFGNGFVPRTFLVKMI